MTHSMQMTADALVRALGGRAAQAKVRSDRASVEAGAMMMVQQPHLLSRAVYGQTRDVVDIEKLSEDCDRRLASMLDFGRTGHWCFCRYRLVALQQARKALDVLMARAA